VNATIEKTPSGNDIPGIREMSRAMLLSVGIGFFMLALKIYAYIITGSAAILSDAAESIVHIIAVSFAAYSFRLSFKPADQTHMYGHDRISFFSAGFEGWMIALAAFYIIYESIHKWLAGLVLENIGVGTVFTSVAVVINGALGWYLVATGRKYHSIVLEANGKHVLTDSWTSIGVVAGLVLITFTRWLPFDPLVAIFVGLNILWTGGKLIRQSIGGLMDESNPDIDRKLRTILEKETERYGIQFHGLRHRNAGNKILVEVHLLFSQHISLADAHEQATKIEQVITKSFPMQIEFLSHLEPLEGHDEIHEKLLDQGKKNI
jgi:cation diffusion facilitator family transporter